MDAKSPTADEGSIRQIQNIESPLVDRGSQKFHESYFKHRAYLLKTLCDFVVRVEPPLGVGGWVSDLK